MVTIITGKQAQPSNHSTQASQYGWLSQTASTSDIETRFESFELFYVMYSCLN